MTFEVTMKQTRFLVATVDNWVGKLFGSLLNEVIPHKNYQCIMINLTQHFGAKYFLHRVCAFTVNTKM